MTDPWLLVANRHFQDMRDVADRERLVRAGATGRATRVRLAIGRLTAMVGHAARDPRRGLTDAVSVASVPSARSRAPA